MATIEFKNNARSTVAGTLAVAETTLNVATGDGANFPSSFPFKLTLFDDSSYPDAGLEIVKCTGRTADALTIVRAQEGSADSEHTNGERVAMLLTAGHMTDIVTKLDTIESSATADQTASEVPNTPAGNIAATNVQAAINELDTEKASVLGADDNYVTDAEKTVIGNTSGSNTGDQTLRTDATLPFTDVTTNNASITKHGFTPKLDDVVTNFLNGQGAWSAPSGGGAQTVNIFLSAEAAYLPQADFLLTGTVSMTNGSTSVTGGATAFDTELQVNDYIKLDADNSASWAKVASIESATGLTLSATYDGTGGASAGSGSGNPADLSEVLGSGRYIGWSALKFDDTLTNPDGGERAGWRIPMPDYDGGNIVLTGAMKPATTPTGAVTFILNIRTIGLATSEGFDKAVTADTGVNMSFSLNTTELSTDVVFATATIDPTNVVSNDMMVIEVDIDSISTLSGDGQLLYILMKYTRA